MARCHESLRGSSCLVAEARLAAYGSNGLEECAKAHELEGRVEHHVVCRERAAGVRSGGAGGWWVPSGCLVPQRVWPASCRCTSMVACCIWWGGAWAGRGKPGVWLARVRRKHRHDLNCSLQERLQGSQLTKAKARLGEVSSRTETFDGRSRIN